MGTYNKEKNLIHQGDILDLLGRLPPKSVDMVFGDPDYNVGINYAGKTYTKTFVEYIDWYIALTKAAMRVLKEKGNAFMMNYPKQNAHLRVHYLDKEFPLVSEYVWVYNTNVGHSRHRFTTAHRSVLHIRKSADNKFYKEQVAQPYKNPDDKRIKANIRNGSKGCMPYSWLNYNLVKNVSKEKTFHACQIPQQLSSLLIRSCTKEGDTVMILFGGSGAELEVCQKLKRYFITAEMHPKYYQLIQERLQKGAIPSRFKLNKQAEELTPSRQAVLFTP